MEQEIRNKLQRATQQIRRLLEEEFAEQLEGTFDILASGKILPSAGKHLDARQRLTRQKLVDAIEHIKAGGKKPQEAVEEYTREAAFKVLNRLVAMRMLEARGLLQECVSKGDQSSGFREFTGLAPGLASLPDGGYRLYLECLFDELSVEVKVLFDRRDSASMLWPRRGALTELLDILGQADLSGVWGEDETIGWVYQYFNSGDERKQMREESQAPRTSRELAVRNQFFTPRYVVEFLTDNTLGRIWYEMRKGTTRLVDECRYMVRRPMEFILPDPDACGLLDTYAGRKEMLTFWRSGTAADMPEDPSTAVVIDWVTRLANDHASGNGFEKYLHQLGDTHDAVLERLFFGKQANEKVHTESLKAEHPVVLMHGIWRVSVEIARSDYGDMSKPISTHPEAGPCWTALRSQLMNPSVNLTQAELLNQPVFVPHRAKKDPRDLKILDPACGSGHFLLYAFDLLIWIYEEAWRDTAGPRSEITGNRLSENYPDLQQLHAALPGLVLAHNLHGIDIDPRAAQIAALALWMRGQRAFNEFGFARNTRAAIAKSNIVCAEPMPGEAGFLDEFIKEHLSESAEGRFLASLVRKVFESMKLAGEAGLLLKIEEDIADEVAKAKKHWLERPAMRQKTLFAEAATIVQQELDLTRGITDASFWEEAEQRIYDALRAYSEAAERIGGFQRRLFAVDTARGFAFIDLCRPRYDVTLMNPPFGDGTTNTRPYMAMSYSESASDIAYSFISRAVVRSTANGKIGVIATRQPLFVSGFEEWRRSILESNSLGCLADLGYGVLDALVEVAAFIFDCGHKCVSSPFLRLLDVKEKADQLQREIAKLSTVGHNDENVRCHLAGVSAFNMIPKFGWCYWLPSSLLARIASFKTLKEQGISACKGLDTADDERFLRAFWEVSAEEIGSSKRWLPIAKGGAYSPCFDDIHLCVEWLIDGATLALNGASIRNKSFYGKEGLTYSSRSTSGFNIKALPEGCAISTGGHGVFAPSPESLHAAAALMMSRVGQLQIEMAVGGGDEAHSGSAARNYLNGIVSRLRAPVQRIADDERLTAIVDELFSIGVSRFELDETSRLFDPRKAVSLLLMDSGSRNALETRDIVRTLRLYSELEARIAEHYGLSANAITSIDLELGKDVWLLPTRDAADVRLAFDKIASLSVYELIAIAVEKLGASRHLTKKAYVADRRFELLCRILDVHPSTVATLEQLWCLRQSDPDTVPQLVRVAMGFALGRWEIDRRMSAVRADDFWKAISLSDLTEGNPKPHPTLILHDDPGHSADVVSTVLRVARRLGEITATGFALDESNPEVQWRTWFATEFFSEHCNCYSKSRKKAPLYWQLATPSASYSVWLYYHHFTRDTFFQVLNEYVKPKRDHERQKLDRQRGEVGAVPTRWHRKEIEDQERFVAELVAMVEEIERIAPLWNPNRHDGVIINFAPLWRLVPQNKSWQKECKECWDKLVAGEYDWAHLAMHLWPERVVPKCVDDASLAIAHGLEEIFWEQDDRDRFQPKAKPDSGWQPVIDQLVKERTSPAVKAALKSLLEAPAAAAPTRSSRARRGTAS